MQTNTKKYNYNTEMLVSYRHLPEKERWRICMDDMMDEYTLTTLEVCETLSCQQKWIKKYIRPYVHYIYLAPAYAQIAQSYLHKNIKDKIWMNRREFNALIRSNMTISRQTIKIPIEILTPPEYWEIMRDICEKEKEERAKYENLKMRSLTPNNRLVLSKMYKQYKKMMHKEKIKYMTENGAELYEEMLDPIKRTMVPHTNVDRLEYELSDLISLKTMASTGRSKELLYREMFQEGYYRLTLQLPDQDGVLTKMVYYVKPKNESFYINSITFNKKRSAEMVTVEYGKWVEFQRK